MGRAATTLRIAVIAAVALTSGGAGTCGSDDGGVAPTPVADFVVTAPDGFAELVPTTAVGIAWQVTASLAYGLELEVVAGTESPKIIATTDLAPGSLTWDGRDLARVAAPPGNYRLRAVALGPDDGEVDTADGDAAHLIVVQGIRFRDHALTFTVAQPGRDLVLTTVARSPLELDLLLDRDLTTAGDELPLLTATIPGELVPVGRSYPFTGRTADDHPIAGGTYVVVAELHARGGIIYRVDGPTLTWTP